MKRLACHTGESILSRSLPSRTSNLLPANRQHLHQQQEPSKGGGEAASINWHDYTIGNLGDDAVAMETMMTQSAAAVGSSSKQKRDSCTNTDHSVILAARTNNNQQLTTSSLPLQAGKVGAQRNAYVGIRMGETGPNAVKGGGAGYLIDTRGGAMQALIDSRRASGPADVTEGMMTSMSMQQRKISMPLHHQASYVTAHLPAVEGQGQLIPGRPASAMAVIGPNSNSNNSWTRSAAQFASAMRSALSDTEGGMDTLPMPHQHTQQQPLTVHQQIQVLRFA